jgi:hypothetical protein
MFTKDISIVNSKLNKKLNVTALEIFFNEYKTLDKQFNYLRDEFKSQDIIIKEIIINTLFQALYNITVADSRHDSASLHEILSNTNEEKALYDQIKVEFTNDVLSKHKITIYDLSNIRHCLLSHLTQGNENQNINKLIKFVQEFGLSN